MKSLFFKISTNNFIKSTGYIKSKSCFVFGGVAFIVAIAGLLLETQIAFFILEPLAVLFLIFLQLTLDKLPAVKKEFSND